jgi:CheY-like chemotaxis protein
MSGTGDARLEGRRVLVVEDEYFIADDIARALRGLGAEVVGPAPDPENAFRLIDSAERIDLAVLDINLQGEPVFPVADALRSRGVPFVFATGYDVGTLPARYDSVPRWEKPFNPVDLVRALSREMRQRS